VVETSAWLDHWLFVDMDASVSPVFAETHVALVISNDNYATLPKLNNARGPSFGAATAVSVLPGRSRDSGCLLFTHF
jgi:hypothetical protein